MHSERASPEPKLYQTVLPDSIVAGIETKASKINSWNVPKEMSASVRKSPLAEHMTLRASSGSQCRNPWFPSRVNTLATL